jgi:hypothetical protein
VQRCVINAKYTHWQQSDRLYFIYTVIEHTSRVSDYYTSQVKNRGPGSNGIDARAEDPDYDSWEYWNRPVDRSVFANKGVVADASGEFHRPLATSAAFALPW